MNSQRVSAVRLLFSACVFCLVSNSAFAQDTESASNTAGSTVTVGAGSSASDASDDDASKRVVCKQVTPLGTRFVKKTCKTVAEWDELRRMGGEAARTGTEQSRMIREAPPGG